jgi:hypothetical protein
MRVITLPIRENWSGSGPATLVSILTRPCGQVQHHCLLLRSSLALSFPLKKSTGKMYLIWL